VLLSSPSVTFICTWCRAATVKLSVAKGMLLRRDSDREATGRILREALAQLDTAAQD
jgi:hypothetical protein